MHSLLHAYRVQTAKKTSIHSQLSRWVRRQFTAMDLLLAIAVLFLAGAVIPVPCADAAFTPSSRLELQGNGGGTLGVFGCVGSCGGSLTVAGIGMDPGNFCRWDRDGPWETGTGNPCTNADTDVPSGQGTGKYGTIGSWDVSKINNMGNSKCIYNLYCHLHLDLSMKYSVPF